MGQLLLAKPYVDKRKKELKEEIIKYGLKPKLVIVRVGDDYASKKYVTNKVKLGTECGVEVEVLHLLEEISQEDLLNEIQNINLRDDISGCLIQLPLPKHINENLVLEALKPELDVDGFARNNLGGLLRGEKTITACTPKGIINLLKYYNIPVTIIATKSDKVSRSNYEKNKKLIRDTLKMVESDDLILFSTVSKVGKTAVHEKIMELI